MSAPGPIAQLEERLNGIEEVVGSSPTGSTATIALPTRQFRAPAVQDALRTANQRICGQLGNTRMPVTEQQRATATLLLSDFRDRCYKLSYAFDALGSGRELLRQQYEDSLDPKYRDAPLVTGRVTNDDPNNIELESVASIKQGELLEGLQRDGEFENLNHQAFVVFIYQLWDEHYRSEIAKVLGFKDINRIKCDLFGDVKRIRHSIIHNRSVLANRHLNGLKVLPKIWNLQPGSLRLTNNMMLALLAEFQTLTVEW